MLRPNRASDAAGAATVDAHRDTAVQAQPSAPAQLSIVVPVYNEAQTVLRVLDRLLAVDFPVAREVIVVDDGSTDGTADALRRVVARPDLLVLSAGRNQGKGAAIRLGIAHARGSILAIQDADLELDPAQLPTLLGPILAGDAEVVYGSRFLNGRPDMPLVSRIANQALTIITNVICRGSITDMETCYKLMPMPVARSLGLESNRFDIEAEITAKLLLNRHRIVELPVEVRSRSKAAGKKIRWHDGVSAVRTLLRYRLAATRGR